MGINLALTRINRLLSLLGNPHINSYKSIHIAGTNGKGSTVAYISSVLTQAQIRNGRFTSPHLLYYNDCISINNEIYPLSKFQHVSELVTKQNEEHKVGCTEFELLTATAFKIFELEKVEYAVIEVGLGGGLDATNALIPSEKGGVILCGITKIGIDHEKFLGSTLSEIASEKAGIIKDKIPCVIDATNDEDVLGVVQNVLESKNAPLYTVDAGDDLERFSLYSNDEVRHLRTMSPLKGSYQLQNLSVAIKILELLKQQYTPKLTKEMIEAGIRNVDWPGRLQTVTYRGIEMLIDGAHNESAALELQKYLKSYREEGIIFVIGLSKGKSVEKLVKYIATDKDVLVATRFSSPEGMPWVSCYDIEEIQMAAKRYFGTIVSTDNSRTVKDTLDMIVEMKENGDSRKVVVCGSLYLCSDVLRLVN